MIRQPPCDYKEEDKDKRLPTKQKLNGGYDLAKDKNYDKQL